MKIFVGPASLPDTENLPEVSFDYPDSSTGHMKTRFVAVTKMDNKYITGYEIQGACRYPFKRYSLKRIAENGIHLRSFTPNQS